MLKMPLSRHRARLIAAAFAAAACFGAASAAQAASCDAHILGPMADGLYFVPSPRLIAAESADALCDTLVAQGLASPAPDASASGTDAEAPQPALIAAVERGRQMLRDAIDADAAAGKKARVVTTTDVWVDVTLAIWNTRTDAITLVHAGKSGTKLNVDADAGVGIGVAYNNGVNSRFVVDDGDAVVVAVRYPIFKNVSASSKYPKYELDDIVYSPYSPQLHQPEMVAYGRQTLEANISAALDAYRQAGVKSRAFPDKLLSDAVDPDLVESIALIEHLSPDALNGPGAQAAMDSIYVTIGANQGDAFDYARSSAGALGLVQFIPSTYALMAKRADLGLMPDFTSGMSDPVNAIKAEIGYLDAVLADMPLSVRDLVAVDPERVDEYLAAAYNGGESRVKKAIASLGDDWSADPAATKAALQKQYDTLFAQAAALKPKILAEDDPAVWKPMQKKLDALRAERAQVQAKINALSAASLRTETALYVQKLRVVLKLLNPPPPPLPQA